MGLATWMLMLSLAVMILGMADERDICGKEGQNVLRRIMHDSGYLCDEAERGYEMMNTTVTMPRSQNISHMMMCYMVSRKIATKGQILTWPKVLVSLGVNYSVIFSASDTYPHYMDPPLTVHWSRLDPDERKEDARALNAVVSYRHLANYWNQLGRRSKLITPISKKQWSKWSLKLTLRVEQLLPMASCADLHSPHLSEYLTRTYSAFWEEWRDLYSFIGFHQTSTQLCYNTRYKNIVSDTSTTPPKAYFESFPTLVSEFEGGPKYYLPKGTMKSLDDIAFEHKKTEQKEPPVDSTPTEEL